MIGLVLQDYNFIHEAISFIYFCPLLSAKLSRSSILTD